MSAVAIDQIVKELCNETGEPGLQNYDTLLGKVIDGIRDLNIFAMPTWKVAEVVLNDYNAICWPVECVKPLIVVMQRNGRKMALAVTQDIIDAVGNTKNTNPDYVSNELTDFFRVDGFQYSWFPVFNWGIGEVYGLNTGYTVGGIVTHDKDRRQSFVRNIKVQDGDQFFFVFKSDGLCDGTYFVPSECKEAIEYFALSKYFRTRNPNLAERNRETYKQEFFKLQRLYAMEDEAQWTSVMLSNATNIKY